MGDNTGLSIECHYGDNPKRVSPLHGHKQLWGLYLIIAELEVVDDLFGYAAIEYQVSQLDICKLDIKTWKPDLYSTSQLHIVLTTV